MRARKSPSIFFTLACAFCTALLLFALTRSFLHDRGKKEESFEIETTKAPEPILLYQGHVEDLPSTGGQNISSSMEVYPPPLSRDPLSDKKEPLKHIVKERETLSSISKKYYGTETKWEKIWEANQTVIPNRNKIKPGIAIVIPEKESLNSAITQGESASK